MFLLLFVLFPVIQTATVTEATTRITTSTFFGTSDTTIAQWMITFDEDLVVMQNLGCSESYQGEIIPSSACNYASKSACGTAMNGTYGQACNMSYCTDFGDWDEVSVGTEHLILVCNYSRGPCTATWRITRTFVSSANLLNGLRLRLTSVNLEADALWSLQHPADPIPSSDWFQPDDTTVAVTYGIREDLSICPRAAPEGTYFTRIVVRFTLPLAEKKIFYFIQPFEIPVLHPISESNRCQKNSFTDWICIDDGEPLRLDWVQFQKYSAQNVTLKLLRFSFPLGTQCPVTVSVRFFVGILFINPILFIDTIPTIYPGDPSPSFSTSGKWNYIYRSNPISNTLHFECGQVPSNLYFTLGNLFSLPPTSPRIVDILITTSPKILISRPLDDFISSDLSGLSPIWFELICPDSLGNSVTIRPCPSYLPVSAYGFISPSCDETMLLRPVPTEDIVFWNFPPVGILHMIPDFIEQPLEGVRLSMNKIALYKIISSISYGQSTIYSHSDPTNCQIRFKGIELFFGRSHRGVNLTVTPNLEEMRCVDNLTDYERCMTLYVGALNDYNHAKISNISFLEWRYGEAGFDLRIQSCFDYMDENFELSVMNGTKYTDQCLIPNSADPCCNLNLLNLVCCLPREIQYPQETKGQIKPEESSKNCERDPTCGEQLLQEFASLSKESRCSQQNPTLNQLTFSETKGWRSCLTEVFQNSSTSFWIPCYQDDDCREPYRNLSFRCDLIAHTCISNYSELVQSFMACVVERSSPTLLSLLNVSNPEGNLTQSLIHLTSPICNSNAAYDLTILPHYRVVNSCPLTSDECLLLGMHFLSRYTNELPYKCLFNQPCSQISKYGKFSTSNCSSHSCRVVSSSNGTSQCPENSCGICFDDTSKCYASPEMTSFNSPETCETQHVCLFPDGQMKFGISKQECLTLGRCVVQPYSPINTTTPLFREALCGAEQCTSLNCHSRGGRCSILDPFDELNSSIVCFQNHSTPFNLVPCSKLRSYPIGCVSPTPSAACFANITRDQAELYSRDTCLNFRIGCRIDFTNTNYASDTILANRSASQCPCRGGQETQESFFQWQTGRWIPAQYVPLSWVSNTSYVPYEIESITDIQMVENLFSQAIQSWSLFWSFSRANCEKYPLLNSINDFVCACQDSDMSICEEGRIPQVIGVTTICPAEERVWDLGDAQVLFSKATFSEGSCLDIRAEQALSSQYLILRRKSISTSFLYANIYQPLEVILNSHGKVVGSALSSSGSSFYFSDVERINFFQFCNKLQPNDPSLNESYFAHYPIWSLAVAFDSGDLHVLSNAEILSVTNGDNSTSQCIVFSKEFFSFEVERIVFFLVKISTNWQDDEGLSTSEYVLLVLASCVYWISRLISFAILLSSIDFWSSIMAKGDYTFFITSAEVIVFAIFRAVLFSLLASSSDMNSVGENILIEFPTFVYLSIVTQHISGFRPDSAQNLKSLFSLAVHLLLCALFIIVICLLDSIQNSPPDVTCRGRIIESSSSLSNTDKARIFNFMDGNDINCSKFSFELFTRP